MKPKRPSKATRPSMIAPWPDPAKVDPKTVPNMRFTAVCALRTLGDFPTEKLAFKAIFHKVKAMIVNGDLAGAMLWEGTWIETVISAAYSGKGREERYPTPFAKARDGAVLMGWWVGSRVGNGSGETSPNIVVSDHKEVP